MKTVSQRFSLQIWSIKSLTPRFNCTALWGIATIRRLQDGIQEYDPKDWLMVQMKFTGGEQGQTSLKLMRNMVQRRLPVAANCLSDSVLRDKKNGANAPFFIKQP